MQLHEVNRFAGDEPGDKLRLRIDENADRLNLLVQALLQLLRLCCAYGSLAFFIKDEADEIRLILIYIFYILSAAQTADFHLHAIHERSSRSSAAGLALRISASPTSTACTPSIRLHH